MSGTPFAVFEGQAATPRQRITEKLEKAGSASLPTRPCRKGIFLRNPDRRYGLHDLRSGGQISQQSQRCSIIGGYTVYDQLVPRDIVLTLLILLSSLFVWALVMKFLTRLKRRRKHRAIEYGIKDFMRQVRG